MNLDLNLIWNLQTASTGTSNQHALCTFKNKLLHCGYYRMTQSLACCCDQCNQDPEILLQAPSPHMNHAPLALAATTRQSIAVTENSHSMSTLLSNWTKHQPERPFMIFHNFCRRRKTDVSSPTHTPMINSSILTICINSAVPCKAQSLPSAKYCRPYCLYTGYQTQLLMNHDLSLWHLPRRSRTPRLTTMFGQHLLQACSRTDVF